MSLATSLDKSRYDVVVVGGSLAGLMCGLALKHAGHDVVILEQAGSQRRSHQVGIGLAPVAKTFLQHHDQLTEGFTHHTTDLKALGGNGSFRVLSLEERDLTSWDTLYYRLRSNFDGFVSPHYPSAPIRASETDGSATYETHRKVLDVTPTDGHDSKLSLKVQDLDTGNISYMESDYVIGADGPDSLIRAKYLPSVQRKYVGYIVWRGTVPEAEVSDSTRELFSRSIVAHMMRNKGSHCIVYAIPGINGSLEVGERFFNFIVYTNETVESLDEIMVDAVDGHRHHNTVPAGRVRREIWSDLVERVSLGSIPEPFLEVMRKIQEPSVQVVTDFCSPRAAFEDGKVLLIGDALALIRPHAAVGSAQAAFHSLAVADYLSEKISVPKWEEKVLTFSFLHWQQSVWWGSFYQQPIVIALVAGIRYWTHVGIERFRCWWNNTQSVI